MPLYEYRCRKCGELTEVLQKLSDPPLRRCRRCRGTLDKLISRTSFQLKGGGWFNEGYGRGKAAKKKDGEGGGSKKDSTPTTGSSSTSEGSESKAASSSA